MAQLESDDLEQLAPNLQQRAARQGSPGSTVALRKYMKVLGEKSDNVPAASNVPLKPRTDGLQPRAGSGRVPQRRFFTIKWRDESVADPEEEDEEEELDPEALKDALLEQAKGQRRALMEAALRLGTGRMPRRREFTISLPLLQPDIEEWAGEQEDEEEQLQLEYNDDKEANDPMPQHGLGWQLASVNVGEQRMLEHAELACEAWEAEEGVLADQQANAALPPANAHADLPHSTAATPGAVLLQQHDAQPQSGSMELQADSQRAQARTPGTSMFGRYTPMEGVPERLVRLASYSKQPPPTVSRSVRPAGTPAGCTPLEGVPEMRLSLRQLPGGPRPLGLPSATRMCSNEQQRSLDSPVEGLVQQGAGRSRDSSGAQAAGANDGFAGFAQPALRPLEGECTEQQQEPVQRPVAYQAMAVQEEDDVDDDNGDYGFADDGGYYEEEEEAAPPPTTAGAAGADSVGGFRFPARPSPAHRVDACMQTGASLGGDEGQAAAEYGAGGSAAALAGDDGYDALDVYGQENPGMHAVVAVLPETVAATRQHAKRRQTRDPGVRLRNELKRKSLAADPRIGRQEVRPGVRRSSRTQQGPLRWWLNEKKEFGREHRTMPTVKNVVHTVPNTPWQMVTDIRRKPAKRQRARAPTPHDLQEAMAAPGTAAQEEQEWGQEEGEEQQEEEEQQLDTAEVHVRRSGRQAASGGQQQAATQRASRQAKAPAAKGKTTKKKAAGSKRRGRR